MKRPVILVTGANAGLGLGLCKRLLIQLSNPVPPDSAALDIPRRDAAGTPFDARDGCTLLLACRNQAKAEAAKLELQELLFQLSHSDDELIQSNRSPNIWPNASSSSVNDNKPLRKREYETKLGAPLEMRNSDALLKYRQSFCAGTKIKIVSLDLSSVASTKDCARVVASEFPYLTHLVLNAGGASWTGINWVRATWEIVTNLHKAVTFPSYKLQRSGEVSKDGFGWVWQINVGGHYLLAHELESLLRASPYATPSRIIWTGSLEANPNDFHANDFQCLNPKLSTNPYESTKYQCELTSLAMDERFLAHEQPPALRSFTAHPGIVATSIFSGVIPAIMVIMMKCVFVLVCALYSQFRLAGHFRRITPLMHTRALSPHPLWPWHQRNTWMGMYAMELRLHGQVMNMSMLTVSWAGKTVPMGLRILAYSAQRVI